MTDASTESDPRTEQAPGRAPMRALCDDLLAEYRALAGLCRDMDAAQWSRPGPFHGWSAWDQVAHLLYFDETALQSARDPAAFARDAARLSERLASGEEISAVTRDAYGSLGGPALLAAWERTHEALVARLAGLEPRARLTWYGPPMSALSFATARLMETWAHGQDVWDAERRRRPPSARLRHIAHLGASTYRWTFINRNLPVPPEQPFIELDAPDGGRWSWGDPASSDQVRGTAEEFCLVVTQRRHVDDTALQVSAGAMREWLLLAQCFAGEPADGPRPGGRKIVY